MDKYYTPTTAGDAFINSMKTDFYAVIEIALKRKNMTKKELSKRMNIPYNTLVSMFKRRSENMNLNFLIAISEVLEIPVEDIMKTILGSAEAFVKQVNKGEKFTVTLSSGEQRVYLLKPEDQEVILKTLDKFALDISADNTEKK